MVVRPIGKPLSLSTRLQSLSDKGYSTMAGTIMVRENKDEQGQPSKPTRLVAFILFSSDSPSNALLSIDAIYKVLSGNHRWTIMKQLVSLLACFSILVFVFCYVYSDFSLFAYCIFRLLLASARASVLSYELHFAGDGSIHQHNRNTLPSSRTRY